MNRLARSTRRTLLLFVLMGIAAPLHGQACTELLLVRHAETIDETPERPLSPAGEARAEALAQLLRDSGVERIYSTDFLRTRGTAAPTAEGLGHEVDIYNPRDLAGFAESLRSLGERALIVGHSNTTPQLVELLGGEPGPPIDEATEHDRLYQVTLCSAASPSTVLLRYGDRG